MEQTDNEIQRRIFDLQELIAENERRRNEMVQEQYRKAQTLRALKLENENLNDADFVTLEMACLILKVSRTTIYNLIASGRLTRYKGHGRIKLLEKEVFSLVNDLYK